MTSSRLLEVLWRWDLHKDGCNQLQPWICPTTLANPNCVSVIWPGRKAYQTLLSPRDFSVLASWWQVSTVFSNQPSPGCLLSSHSYSPVMDLLWALFVSMLALCVAIPMDAAVGSHSLFSCEPITLRMCQGLPYNSTFMPNMLKHYDQQTAALAMEVCYVEKHVTNHFLWQS